MSISRRRRIAVATLAGVASFGLFGPSVASATPVGGLDATFNTGGSGANTIIRAIGFTQDGKVYIGGDFSSYNGTAVKGIARLNTDGSLDTTFNAGGAGLDGNGAKIRSLDVDPVDGDVYIAGNFTTYNGTTVENNSVIRLNSDGTLDNGFAIPRIENSNYAGQPASLDFVKKIGDLVFVSGQFDSVGGGFARGLAAFTTTGTIDSTFGVNAQLSDGMSVARAYDVLPVPDSTDYYILGSFRAVNGSQANGIARVNNDGSVDSTYDNNANTGANNSIRGWAVLPDGKLLLAGNFTQFNGVTTAKGLVRVNPDATLDTTFQSPSATLTLPTLLVDGSGHIYVSGGIGSAYQVPSGNNLVRLNSDGTLDPSFDVTASPNSYDIKIKFSPDGKLYTIGSLTNYGTDAVGYIARVNIAEPVPAAVSNVRVTINGTVASVSWDAPATGSAPTSYLAEAIEVSLQAAGLQPMSVSPLNCTATAPATTCNIAGLVAGKKYNFVVTAINDSGSSTAAQIAEPILIALNTTTLPATGSHDMPALITLACVSMIAGAILRRRPIILR